MYSNIRAAAIIITCKISDMRIYDSNSPCHEPKTRLIMIFTGILYMVPGVVAHAIANANTEPMMLKPRLRMNQLHDNNRLPKR